MKAAEVFIGFAIMIVTLYAVGWCWYAWLYPNISRFQGNWDRVTLPVTGAVRVIENGKPGVGLSAMQMSALGVERGLVRLEFNRRTCEATVWNNGCWNGCDTIIITNSVARALRCGIDDEIRFTEVIAADLPVHIH